MQKKKHQTATDRDGAGVAQLDRALDVGSGGVHGGVYAERRLIDAQAGDARVQRLTAHVDLDQVAGRDLAVEQAVGRRQEVLVVLAQARLMMQTTAMYRLHMYIQSCIHVRVHVLNNNGCTLFAIM